MNTSVVSLSIVDQVAEIKLIRPEIHNAFDDQLVAELIVRIQEVTADEKIRLLVLTGEGNSFSAGANLNWMRRMALASEADNRRDAENLARLMRSLAYCSKPTIARVNGSAFGGGVGLIACCDIAIAVDSAKFGLTETRLGLVPAVISPYVIHAIGLRQARRYFQTGEIFSAHTALQIGLLHQIVGASSLDQEVSRISQSLLSAGPIATGIAKQLGYKIAGLSIESQQQLDLENSSLIARLRVSAEGQEGIGAFLEKRNPAWLAFNQDN